MFSVSIVSVPCAGWTALARCALQNELVQVKKLGAALDRPVIPPAITYLLN